MKILNNSQEKLKRFALNTNECMRNAVMHMTASNIRENAIAWALQVQEEDESLRKKNGKKLGKAKERPRTYDDFKYHVIFTGGDGVVTLTLLRESTDETGDKIPSGEPVPLGQGGVANGYSSDAPIFNDVSMSYNKALIHVGIKSLCRPDVKMIRGKR